MTNDEMLAADGYIQFSSVIPEDLRIRCIDEINKDANECWQWTGLLAEEFRTWFRAFLAVEFPDIHGEAALTVFNRYTGSYMYWHCDSTPANIVHKRVFCCAYFTDTFDGRGPIRVVPGSHLGDKYDILRARVLQFRIESSDPDPLIRKNLIDDFPDLIMPIEGEKILEMPSGTILVANERIMHGVKMNKRSGNRTMVMWWRVRD